MNVKTKPLDNSHPQANNPKDNENPNGLHSRADVRQWRCMNCGQHIFTTVQDTPPEICAYCCDMTTWQAIEK